MLEKILNGLAFNDTDVNKTRSSRKILQNDKSPIRYVDYIKTLSIKIDKIRYAMCINEFLYCPPPNSAGSVLGRILSDEL